MHSNWTFVRARTCNRLANHVNAVFMLGNDTPLPSPKQPAFILKGTYNSIDKSTSAASNSINEITLFEIDGC